MAFDTGQSETISQINVTPLVDVMLVLLVIFMVTAPILQQGYPVELPKAEGVPLVGEEQHLVVSVTSGGDVYLNDTAMTSVELTEKLTAIEREHPGRRVFLRADAAARYGTVAHVMEAIRKSGLTQLGMVTEIPGPNERARNE
jgi:biopolymer transport protein TolR